MIDSKTSPDSPSLTQPVPGWRREPYRLFFPLGLLLAWAGVLHWLLHALGALPDYRPVFHSIAQIQGFMICFAVGFLFTAIPRRTGTAPPAAWQIALAAIAPVGSTVAAWFERFAISQIFWFVLVSVLVAFGVQRLPNADAARRPPNSFVWIPLSFAVGLVGSLLIAVYGILGEEYFALHELGRLFLLQGTFLGLVVGVGGMVLPLIGQGDGPPDGAATHRDRWIRSGHLLAALAMVGTFWIEIGISLRAGLGLRAALVLGVLLVAGGIVRPPRVHGWHRWLVWLSAWMIPTGYVIAMLFPAQKKAGLHVVFIGGFALMALTVGLHVTLAHGGYSRMMRGRPWQVPAYGGLLLGSALLRTLVDFDPQRFFFWIGIAAGTFLLATLIWSTLVLPRLWAENENR
jgi:uncharacterized protein involved in response to NO